MKAQYRCRNEKRREIVTNTKGSDGKPILNGIDYLEVEPGQTELKIYLLKDLPQNSALGTSMTEEGLSKENISIEGGVRVKGINVIRQPEIENNILTITVDKPGDFSNYTFRLINVANRNRPLDGFDPQLSEVQFSFRVECSSGFDCREKIICPQERLSEPKIDYLAKDYASFRQLMLDRLSVLSPSLRERNPADVMITLVEALAYLGDHLSYYQDAVATEAYLGTARKRTSIRRHARLLDYFMHDGCNARAWVVLELEDTNADPGAKEKEVFLPAGTTLLSRTSAPAGPISADLLPDALEEGAQVFETMHDIMLYGGHPPDNSSMDFYSWSDELCCLPKGAIRATLEGHYPNLNAGDVLIFEENRSPTTGQEEDADPTHRWAVRLTDVKAFDSDNEADEGSKKLVDPLNSHLITEIEWNTEDALPFPLCLTAQTDADHGQENIKVSLALRNVVLADHGRTLPKEDLDSVPSQGCYRPALKYGPVTQQGYVQVEGKQDSQWVPFDKGGSASSVFFWDHRSIKPVVKLLQKGSESRPWQPQSDLLESGSFSRDFVLELDDDGLAYLRFGDDIMGEQPEAGSEFSAVYRVGNGKVGNVGRDTITNIIDVPGIKSVRNPLPAQGGEDPEDMEQVRLFAPVAFRKQERAVTEADYAEVAERHTDVQKAVATIRWTGSWYTVFIAIDRRGGLPVDEDFKKTMLNYLDLYRMMGYDLEIGGPTYVPLDIKMEICVKPGYFQTNVKEALLDAFSNMNLPQGGRGFFHPDNFTFGQPVYLSRIYETAMDVPGVASVEVKKFQRWGRSQEDESTKGILPVEGLEIIRLDNDSNFPENGRLDFDMNGGL